jgi:hypothetical protein
MAKINKQRAILDLPVEQRSMTATEVTAELNALREEIGPRAYLSLHVSVGEHSGDKPIYAAIDAQGIRQGGPTFSVQGYDFAQVLAALRTGWAEFQDEHCRRMTADMALEIIRLTDVHGACTDAALRGDRFTVDEVARWGAAACAKANEMAGRGPFEIVSLRGANGEVAA